MSGAAQELQPTYYQILQLPPNGRPVDAFKIRLAYRRALLLHHPDKKFPSSTTSLPVAQTSNHTYSIDQITEAYNTLSNAVKKANYDKSFERNAHELNKSLNTNQHSGVATYDLEELSYNHGTGTWSRKCRCGDETAYTLTESNLEREAEHGEIYVNCKGCSLSIRVFFDTASTVSDVENMSRR